MFLAKNRNLKPQIPVSHRHVGKSRQIAAKLFKYEYQISVFQFEATDLKFFI